MQVERSGIFDGPLKDWADCQRYVFNKAGSRRGDAVRVVSREIAIRPVRTRSLIPSGLSMLIIASTLSTSPVISMVYVFGEESTILARKISASRIASSRCSGLV